MKVTRRGGWMSAMALLLTLVPAPSVTAGGGCSGLRVTIAGDEYNNALYGTPGRDVIYAGDGYDSIYGYGGDDVICAGPYPDHVEAGPGDDVVFGGTGADVIYGFDGDDRLVGGGDGDILFGSSGADRFDGGDGPDYLRGDRGPDRIDGGPGRDIADYSLVDRAVDADLARDRVTGQGADRIPSIEALIGSSKDDRLFGDRGTNVITGMDGDDVLDARGGLDLAGFAFTRRRVRADLRSGIARGQGRDVLRGFEGLIGSPDSSDVLMGDDRANALLDSDVGYDRLVGRGGNDVLRAPHYSLLRGGAGNDILKGTDAIADYSTSPHPVTVDLAHRVVSGEGVDRLLRLDAVIGSRFADSMISAPNGDAVLNGGPGPDVLTGTDERETLSGGAGDDRIVGGLGHDFLYGNEGDDYVEGGEGIDHLGGAAGDDELLGGADNDFFTGDNAGAEGEDPVPFGNDLIDAGSGDLDELWLESVPSGVSLDLAAETMSGEGEDRVIGIDWVHGTQFDDRLVGTDGPNVLQGNGGNDEIVGLGGDDTLDGGFGLDVADGGEGVDGCPNAETTTGCEHARAARDAANDRARPPAKHSWPGVPAVVRKVGLAHAGRWVELVRLVYRDELLPLT